MNEFDFVAEDACANCDFVGEVEVFLDDRREGGWRCDVCGFYNEVTGGQ